MTPVEPPPVAFVLELADHKAMTAHICAPLTANWNRLGVLIVLAVPVGVIASRFVTSPTSFLLGMAAMAVLLWAVIKVVAAGARRRLEPTPGGCILCQYRLALSPEGVDIQTPHWQSLTRWPAIVAIEETVDHVFFKIDTIAAYTVPKRAFANVEAQRQFVDAARYYFVTASAGTG